MLKNYQVPILTTPFREFEWIQEISRCPHFWDRDGARFSPCFSPYIQLLPVAIATFILSFHVASLVFKFWPRWLRGFNQELVQENASMIGTSWRRMLVLVAVSFIGFSVQIISIVASNASYAIFLAISWAISGLVSLLSRHRPAPVSLLVIYFAILISQIILVSDSLTITSLELLNVMIAFGGVIVVVTMPLRDPRLPSNGISPPYSQPSTGLRSPEDNLTIWQFMTVAWMSPLISLGKKRKLGDEDVWDLPYEFQHKGLNNEFRELRGSFLKRLLIANGMDLAISSSLGIVELSANLSVTIFLQLVLQSMEDFSKRPAITYAILSLVARLIACQSAVFNLWYSRRAYERSRGEMIVMLYEKMLSRKIIGLQGDTEECDEPEEASTPESSKSLFSKIRSLVAGGSSAKKVPSGDFKKIKQSASTGKILNLMRNDAYEIAQRFWEFQMLITRPLALIFSVFLIWRIIGWPCLFGVVTVFAAQALNAVIARILIRWEVVRRAATDDKLQKTSHFVEAIRHLRWYGWQDAWLSGIMDSRQHELNLRIVTSILNVMISFTNTFASGLFPVAAFYAYTTLAGLPLSVDVAFPALELFKVLETNLKEIPGLITVLLNASVAVGRINEFMDEPDKAPAFTLEDDTATIDIKNASFAWPGGLKDVLKSITVQFPIGLTIICGEVAAGKTALIQAILGELDETGGILVRPGGMIGFCGQTPWLQTMSIRDNILFSSPYNEVRYKQVLEACALLKDLASFKHGDLTEIGENGIGLSGGQRARVALARAVYSQSKVLLLDDPLSALDYQTAEKIVDKCISGPLLESRTVILVTHRTELCHGIAKQIIEIKGGEANFINTTDAVRVGNYTSMDNANPEASELDKKAAVPEKFLEEEYRAQGGVQAAVYWEYIKAGKVKWWLALVCVLGASRLIDIWQTWFMKQWAEAYDRPELVQSTGFFDDFPSPEKNIHLWLIGFLLLSSAVAATFLLSQIVMIVIIYSAGKKVFIDVMDRVAHATFRFYDVTPVGRLMNRLTSDIGTIDGNISTYFQAVAQLSIAWISSLIVIASVTPSFFFFAIALTFCFIMIFLRFLPASQNLRRLEMVSLSPLISNFGSLFDGLTTVRAFRSQSRFLDQVVRVTDTFQKNDHFYWSLQAWLVYRFDTLSAVSTFILTIIALYSNVSAGLTAFVLIAASKFVVSTHSLCKYYAQLQMDFVSVERVVELLHLEKESSGLVDPPAGWPSTSGDIVFEDVTIRYAPSLDPSLSNLSAIIPAGSNTAILGRTGSGKSTLALSLLATLEPETGRILIDNIDLSKVNRQALRSRITFLAQEPTLFSGTMRQNLDPLLEYTDEECAEVLQKIAGKHQWTLDMLIDAAGRGLSQGQRQLVGLARAMLRRSSIIILDEATASIDTETSMRIQQVLQEDMSDRTVVIIAHRVEAVRNADYAIVLGNGQVLEAGKPDDILLTMGPSSVDLAT